MSYKNVLFFNNPNLQNLNLILISILPISLLTGTLVLNLLIILICLIFIFEKKKELIDYFKNKHIYFLLIIYFYLLLNSLFISQNIESHIRAIGFIRYIILVIILSDYFFFKPVIFREIILRTWFSVFSIVSIDLLIEYFYGKNILGFQSNYSGRLTSFTGDELRIGGFYFGFIIFTLSFINEKIKNNYIFFIILIFFIFISLIIGERANFIKFFLISFSVFMIYSFHNKNFFLNNSFLLIFLISFLIYSYPKYLDNNIYGKIKSYNIYHLINFDKNEEFNLDEIIDNHRHFKHYKIAYNIFEKNILFGVGIKNFRNKSQTNEYNNFKDLSGGSTHPHQVHFEILSELGIVGYILMIGNILFVTFASIKKKDTSPLNKFALWFVIISFIPLIPSGSFFSSYNATIFWINYAMVIGFLIQKNKIVE